MTIARKWIFPLFLLAALTGCSTQGAKPTPTLVPTPAVGQKPTYTVERGEVSKVLELRGRVIPIKQQDLFFGADGYVKKLHIGRGDSVKAGDLLAELEEPANYATDLAAAQLALEQAQNDLATFKLDMPVKIAEAQLAVVKAQDELTKATNKRDGLKLPRSRDPLALAQAEANLTAAKQAYDEAQKAYDGSSEGSGERASALGWLIEARRSYYQAVSVVNWFKGKVSDQEVALADAELTLAQAKYDRAIKDVEHWNQTEEPIELRLAKAKVSDAEAKLSEVQKSKANVELRAPFDGQITSIAIATGDQVSARKAAATLADPTQLEISVIPSPTELADMGVGQNATVRLGSQQGKDFPAKVRLLPDLTSKDTNKDSSARIVLKDTSVALALNEAATIIINIETRPGVLWLPPAALRTFQGRDFVFVDENGIQRRVDIRLGLESADRIEIISGLEEGQIVVGP